MVRDKVVKEKCEPKKVLLKQLPEALKKITESETEEVKTAEAIYILLFYDGCLTYGCLPA